jgi:hypothetical protein
VKCEVLNQAGCLRFSSCWRSFRYRRSICVSVFISPGAGLPATWIWIATPTTEIIKIIDSGTRQFASPGLAVMIFPVMKGFLIYTFLACSVRVMGVGVIFHSSFNMSDTGLLLGRLDKDSTFWRSEPTYFALVYISCGRVDTQACNGENTN